MRTTVLATFALLVVASTSASTAQASSLNAAQVPRDAKWVVHVDFEQMRATKVAEACRKELAKHKDFDRKIKECTEKLGMNPMQDLLGATLYDNGYQEHQGVVLIHVAKLDREKLVALFKKKHPDHKTSKYGDRVIYTWTDKHRHRGEQILHGAFANDNTIALSSDRGKLTQALDVVSGKRKSLGSDAELLKGLGNKPIFVLHAIDIDTKHLKQKHLGPLTKIKEVTVVWREAKDQLLGQYQIVTDSAETAKSFRAIVDGFKALATLKVSEKPLALKLVNGLSTHAKGETLLLNYTAKNDDVIAAAAKLKQLRSKYGDWHKRHSGDHHDKKKDSDKKQPSDDLKKLEI